MPRFRDVVIVGAMACGSDRAPGELPRNVGRDIPCTTEPDTSYLRGEPLGAIERGTAPDLDGDNRSEHWVTARGLCGGSGNCVYTIFDGASCRAIGIVGAAGFRPRLIAGTREFIVFEQMMHVVREARYAWTGEAYARVAARVCRTNEDPTCRQCQPWQKLPGTQYPVDAAGAGWPAIDTSLGPATSCDPRE